MQNLFLIQFFLIASQAILSKDLKLKKQNTKSITFDISKFIVQSQENHVVEGSLYF